MTDKPKGRCTVCGNEYTLTPLGKVWPHQNGRTSLGDPRRGQRCEGAGELPKEKP